MISFKKATKAQAKLRMAIHGPSGSGKTWTALAIASGMGAGVEGNAKVALLDTEHGSAAKYADHFDFDVVSVTEDYNPDKVIETIRVAGESGYDVLVIDNMSLFWNGSGGFLDLVDREVTRQKARGGKPDTFAAWKDIDPIYRRMVQAILSAPLHVIVTLRAKTEYERVNEGGKTSIRKIGLAPEMRDSFQYEMDIEGMMDHDHHFAIGKTRCAALDGKVFMKPGREVADIIKGWLMDGVPVPAAGSDDGLLKVRAAARTAVEHGWQKAEVVRMLREAGCTIDNSGIAAVPAGKSAELARRLSSDPSWESDAKSWAGWAGRKGWDADVLGDVLEELGAGHPMKLPQQSRDELRDKLDWDNDLVAKVNNQLKKSA